MNQHFATTSAPLPFTPKCLGADSKVSFLVTPITSEDFDRLGGQLYINGIYQPAQDTYRSTLIVEIFNLFDEVEAEKKANLMDEVWQADDIFASQLRDWKAIDEARQFDEARDGTPRPSSLAPKPTTSIRQRSEAQLVVDHVQKESEKYRALSAYGANFTTHQDEGLVRLVLEGWEGLKTPFSKVAGIVPADTFAAMLAEIGPIARRQLITFVLSHGSISVEERGNSDLPPESGSDLTGSPAPSGASENSDGSLTSEAAEIPSTSSSTPTPETASAAITAPSSTSTTSASGESGNTADTPMAEG